MNYNEIIENLLNNKNNYSNKQQINSFKFLLILFKYIHDLKGDYYVEIFYRHPYEDLPDTEVRNDYDNILAIDGREIKTLVNVEKDFSDNEIKKGFNTLFYVFKNARLTSIGRGTNDHIYMFIVDTIDPILNKIESIFYKNDEINNENFEEFVNTFYKGIEFIEDINKFQDTLKKNKKRKLESINDNGLLQKIIEFYGKKFESLNEDVKSSKEIIEFYEKKFESYEKKFESYEKKFESYEKKFELSENKNIELKISKNQDSININVK